MPCDHKAALALIKNGDWEAAHRMVQTYSDPLSCRMHAYLHRVEGDTGNAGYWYRQAGERFPDNSLEEELALLDGLVR